MREDQYQNTKYASTLLLNSRLGAEKSRVTLGLGAESPMSRALSLLKKRCELLDRSREHADRIEALSTRENKVKRSQFTAATSVAQNLPMVLKFSWVASVYRAWKLYKVMRQTGFLDHDYYCAAYRINPLFRNLVILHYSLVGENHNYAPNETYKPADYLGMYPDVAGHIEGPTHHFLKHGGVEGRRGLI